MSTRHARIELRPVEGSTKATEPHYLRLIASNGQVLATSETYANRQNARRAVRGWLDAFCEVMHMEPGWGDAAFGRHLPVLTVVEFTTNGDPR